MSENPVSIVPPAENLEETPDERSSRHLLKAVHLMHSLNERERELTLVLMQAIIAWNGLAEAA